MQLISTILKLAPGVILWAQKGWLAGVLGFVAALILTWVFTLMTISSGSTETIQKGRFWIGPAVFVIVLTLGFLIF